jgi:hypothetical protein
MYIRLQLAHAIWMGRWNQRHDKEPSKKDEVAFKEFLISKYERKQWYRDPEAVKKERVSDADTTPAAQPKLLPPPSTKKSAGTAATFAVQPPSSSSPATFVVQPPSSSSPASVPQPSPAAVLSPTISNAVVSNTSSTVATSTQKPDLLGGLEGDPFHTKSKAPPPGAVAVLPAGAVPLLNATKEVLQLGTGSIGSSPAVTSKGDKYAALASLDVTLKELRVKEDPSPQPQPSPATQAMPAQGQNFGGGGSSNPFGALSGANQQQPQGQQFNPFATPQSQPVTGGLRSTGPGYSAFQGAPGVMSSVVGMPPGQQFQSQPYAGVGQQVLVQGMGQPVQQMSHQIPGGQWQQWGHQGQLIQGQWRAQQGMQQAAMQQAAMQQAAVQQHQWRSLSPQQQMFGGVPAAMQGGMNPRGFENMGMPQAQQQQLQQSHFGGFVSAGSSPTVQSATHQQQTKLFGGGGGGFNWGTNVASSTQHPPPSSSSTAASGGGQTTATSSVGMGWSTDLAKQAPSSSGWGSSTNQANVSGVSTGWSWSLQPSPAESGGGWGRGSGMNTSGGVASAGGWGGLTSEPSSQQGQVQQQGNWGAAMNIPSNPFASPPQTHRNPFV